MHPVLLHWRGIKIYSYPAMLYLGLVLGIAVGNVAANLAGLDSARVFLATFALIVPALIGARLFYVAAHWDVYHREPRRIWRRSEGGAAMYGGLPFALLLSVPLLRALGLPFGAFWDVMTFTIFTGMVLTRIGCLLNGCCAGRPTDGWLALCLINARGERRRRIPTQLLEAAWGGLLLVGAVGLWGRLSFPGALFLYALAGYGVGRFVLEMMREERRSVLWGFTAGQVVSAGVVLASLVIALVNWPA
ncbi:MAG: prolipoprotein diacylglyceryl transferase [Anaerolineae bacterium]|nr:prolipoprotein diacylglyceryl transferase [Anaerolineae bacterium]